MLGYVMVGTNDLARATKFYDATLEPLNLVQVECLDIYTAYAPKDARDDIKLYVTKPFDQETATVGNGSMIALKAPSISTLQTVQQPQPLPTQKRSAREIWITGSTSTYWIWNGAELTTPRLT